MSAQAPCEATTAHAGTTVPASVRWDVLVVVPARDEEWGIARTLRSVCVALEHASAEVGLAAVVVVADRCSDHTARIARRVLHDRDDRVRGLVRECEAGTVGGARQLGVELGRTALTGRPAERIWIANTDADTVVPHDWVVQQLRAADAGFHAVAGTVDLDCTSDVPHAVRRRFRETYADALPASGSHVHVHGANLGVRLDAYDLAGGWGRLARSEDRDLWTRLQQRGRSVLSTVDLTVTTSGRADGRVPEGFAHFLHRQSA